MLLLESTAIDKIAFVLASRPLLSPMNSTCSSQNIPADTHLKPVFRICGVTWLHAAVQLRPGRERCGSLWTSNAFRALSIADLASCCLSRSLAASSHSARWYATHVQQPHFGTAVMCCFGLHQVCQASHHRVESHCSALNPKVTIPLPLGLGDLDPCHSILGAALDPEGQACTIAKVLGAKCNRGAEQRSAPPGACGCLPPASSGLSAGKQHWYDALSRHPPRQSAKKHSSKTKQTLRVPAVFSGHKRPAA